MAGNQNSGMTSRQQENAELEDVRWDIKEAEAEALEAHNATRRAFKHLQQANARLVLLLQGRGMPGLRDLERPAGLTHSVPALGAIPAAVRPFFADESAKKVS